MSNTEVYTNARGEFVVPYHIFKELKFDAVMSSTKQPYPKPKRRYTKKRRRNAK